MRRLYAVFGKPVLHSKSPLLFNAAFKNHNLDAYYTRIRVENPEEIVKVIRELNIAGANVTTPFKEEVIPLLDDLSAEAKSIGAINTIKNDDGFLKGYNTDFLGVVRSIEEAGVSINGKTCLVIGAGGAAKAAVYGLVSAGARVYIANRTEGKAKAIASRFGCKTIPLGDLPSTTNQFDVVVSALLPDVDVPIRWNSVSLFMDANYRKSVMAEKAEIAGVRMVKGEQWLINQAVGSFSVFFGVKPLRDVLIKGIAQVLDYSNIKVAVLGVERKENILKNEFDLIATSNEGYKNEINLRL